MSEAWEKKANKLGARPGVCVMLRLLSSYRQRHLKHQAARARRFVAIWALCHRPRERPGLYEAL